MGSEKIAEVLKRFGIPSDMLYIFAKELSSLVANGIVESKYNASYIDRMQYFEEMTLDIFSLTEKGVKMFNKIRFRCQFSADMEGTRALYFTWMRDIIPNRVKKKTGRTTQWWNLSLFSSASSPLSSAPSAASAAA
jgi:hypothetical protein